MIRLLRDVTVSLIVAIGLCVANINMKPWRVVVSAAIMWTAILIFREWRGINP